MLLNVWSMEEEGMKSKCRSTGAVKGRKKRGRTLRRIHPNAAGIDCGSESHYVAVPADRDDEPVRKFRTFTTDLHRLADWLLESGIETVAMEATGVYWIPIYEILEERGLEVLLVNARHVRNVPGRKTDVADCQWIQELHSFGLLRGSFRPSAEIARLRAYLRHREKLIQDAGDHVRRMQKALIEMNVQLHNVISDVTGVTGMLIMRDIVAGVTDPKVLASHRHSQCRASESEIEASLSGSYRPEHVFVLQQNLELYDAYQRQTKACDAEIESLLHEMATRRCEPDTPLPSARSRFRATANAPRFEIREVLYRLSGADLTQIDSIGPYTALRLISEIGTDMTRWPTEKNFTSWMTVAPPEQDNRWPPAQLQDPALCQPCCRDVAHVCHERWKDIDRPWRVLSATGLPSWQGQSDHRHSPENRRSRLSCFTWRHRLPRFRCPSLRGTTSHTDNSQPSQTRADTRLRAHQSRNR